MSSARPAAVRWGSRLGAFLTACVMVFALSGQPASALDLEAPVLEAFDFSPKTVDVTDQSVSIRITARVTDASGADAPVALVTSDTTTQSLGFGEMELVSGTSQDGIYERTVTIPRTAAPGNWTVKIYPLSDRIGNDGTVGFHLHDQKLMVINGPQDHSAPVLREFDFTPKTVDVTEETASITVTARVTDATGAHEPTLTVSSDTTTQSLGFGPMSRVSGSAKDGIYRRTVTVPTTAAHGNWTVKIYPLSDSIGNGDSTFHDHTAKLRVVNMKGLTVPSAPTSVVAVTNERSATVYWLEPKSNGGAVVSGYKVVATPGGRTVTVPGDAREATISGLASGTRYQFTVHAINEIGTGPASAPYSTVTPPARPKPSPTPAPQPEKPFDVYTEPGTHYINGRYWRTTCQKYSSTVTRCTTEIQATQVSQIDGRFVQNTGWVFNNLTYAASPRGQWKTNPLAAYGVVGGKASWTANDGRKWRTECDTSTTGRNGCRSFIQARVIESYTAPDGTRQFRWVSKEIFNNMVRFK